MKLNKEYLYILFLIIFELIVYILGQNISYYINIFLLLVTTLGLVYCFIYKKKKKIKYNTIATLIIIIGIILRNIYICKTSIYNRQNDVLTLDFDGHLRYIYVIFKTGKLPNTNHWLFYHPPLHHLICALWLKINSLIGFSLEKSMEGIQTITIIYSSLIMFIQYKIINKIKINDKYKLMLIGFIATFPSFILLSGSINNDCLVSLLQFFIVYYLINWYENNNWKNTIILAVSTGLCVMTKMNGAVLAVPILYVFIKKLLEELKKKKKNIKSLLLKIFTFGIISLPIGLWYQVRNYMLFGGNNVPTPNDLYNVSNYSIYERFFSISIKSLNNIFCLRHGEYNVLSYIIKTSLFGEFSYDVSFIHIFMIYLNLVLIIISTIFIIKYIFKKDKQKKKNIINNILLVTWVANIVSFYIFNIKYPYSCTMNYRYIIPTAFTGIVLTVFDMNKNNKKYNTIIDCLIITFIITCAIFVILI